MDHLEESVGREYAFKADVDYKFDEGSFFTRARFGARYADRASEVRYTTYNWGALSEVWSGSNPVSFAQQPGQTELYTFPNFFRGATNGSPSAYYYTGNMTDDYQQAAAYFQSIGNLWKSANGSTATTWSPLAQRAGVVSGTPYLPSEIQLVNQQDKNAFAQLNFATPGDLFPGVRMSGNIGVRYVLTDVTSAGSIGAPTRQQTGTTDEFEVGVRRRPRRRMVSASPPCRRASASSAGQPITRSGNSRPGSRRPIRRAANIITGCRA
jgi:hypothetical protein